MLLTVGLIALTVLVLVGKRLKGTGEKAYTEKQCSLCSGSAGKLVGTSCGCTFDGECLFEVLLDCQDSLCPVCRVPVNMIFVDFEPAEDDQELVIEIARFNVSRAGGRGITETVYETSVLVKRLVGGLSVRSSLVFWRPLGVLTLGLGYLLIPVNLLSEETLGLTGIFDDFIVVALSLFISSTAYYNIINQQAALLLMS